MDFFDIHTICFTLWNYPMSYLELAGFLTGIVAIYMASRASVVNFYIGLLNCAVYFALFYQMQLYSSMLLQLVFFGINVFGIYKWTFPNENEQNGDREMKITRLSPKEQVVFPILTLLVGLLVGFLVVCTIGSHQNHSYTYFWDAVLTVGSVVAQYLLTRKKIDNWYFWLIIDVNYVALCLVTHLWLTAVLYAVYIGIAAKAVWSWRKECEPYGLKDNLK